MSTYSKFIVGQKLKSFRIALLLTREDVRLAIGIPVSTLERIESGEEPYPEKWLNLLCEFYVYEKKDLYNENKSVADWVTLRRRMLKYHRDNSVVINILNTKPAVKKALTQRVLRTEFLKEFHNTEEVRKHLINRYNWTYLYTVLKVALDGLSKEKLIERRKIGSSPYEYRKNTNRILSSQRDIIDAIKDSLEEIVQNTDSNLVIPVFEKMAKMLFLLRNGPQKRDDIFTYADYKNATNNINKTLKVLEDLKLVEKTIKDKPTSSKQMYRLTEKGRDVLRKVGVEVRV